MRSFDLNLTPCYLIKRVVVVNKEFRFQGQYNIELVGHLFLVRLEQFMQKRQLKNLNLGNEKYVLKISSKGGCKDNSNITNLM